MKGIILAGGTGTRLAPLTKVTNKHLLPVGREPMIFNPIRQLISAEIKDILVITSKEHMGDIVQLLGSGAEFGCSFTFKVQESAGGIAHALALAEGFSNGGRITVILGDNILTHSIKSHVDEYLKKESGAYVLIKKVGDPERYGVAALDEQKKMIIKIEEKPSKPESDYAVIGVYMYDSDVFSIIRTIKPSTRGELEISSVNNEYIARGKLQYGVVNGGWTDAGTFESLQYANSLLLEVKNNIFTEKNNENTI
ncbi:sugar phosphate nucleotidyltransferase [Methanoplanus limicola]|uniref:glucose-1-phosphate thymidylyltransferase n=1 Tax=Methanoplanus limicola DSM 2279 TaxID=937775 RepID=H1Z1X6_9EURY|nr:sugar phosphate nucleotidyltransferase [Methanoplanus limicola]EHQ35443.1 Glucose-1-phosphate thymidylyltransferase [Methanoplanus limicola DSM 2279]